MKVYILSGGKSSRMGEDKGLKLLNGKPIISYLLGTVKKLTNDVCIVANSENYTKFNTTLIPDLVTEKGPLGGIYTALNDAKEAILILSVDTPFISSEGILALIDSHQENEITVAYHSEQVQPLFAIYPYNLMEVIVQRISDNKLKLITFLEENDFKMVNIKLSPIEGININTLTDFTTAENYLLYAT